MSKASLNWRFVPVTKVDVTGWNAILDKLKEVWGSPTPPRAGCAFRTTWYDTTWWVGDDNILNYVDPETFELKRVRCTDNPTGQNSRDY